MNLQYYDASEDKAAQRSIEQTSDDGVNDTRVDLHTTAKWKTAHDKIDNRIHKSNQPDQQSSLSSCPLENWVDKLDDHTRSLIDSLVEKRLKKAAHDRRRLMDVAVKKRADRRQQRLLRSPRIPEYVSGSNYPADGSEVDLGNHPIIRAARWLVRQIYWVETSVSSLNPFNSKAN